MEGIYRHSEWWWWIFQKIDDLMKTSRCSTDETSLCFVWVIWLIRCEWKWQEWNGQIFIISVESIFFSTMLSVFKSEWEVLHINRKNHCKTSETVRKVSIHNSCQQLCVKVTMTRESWSSKQLLRLEACKRCREVVEKLCTYEKLSLTILNCLFAFDDTPLLRVKYKLS